MQLLPAHLAHHHRMPGRVHDTPRDRLSVGRLWKMPRLGTPHAYGLAGVPRVTVACGAPAYLGVDHWRILGPVAAQWTLTHTCSHTRNVTLSGTGMPAGGSHHGDKRCGCGHQHRTCEVNTTTQPPGHNLEPGAG